MAELEIRPTLKFIRLGYAAAASALAAALIWWGTDRSAAPAAAAAGAGLLLAWAAARHVKQRRIRCRLEGANLRYEEGLVSTTVKTIPLSNIQDVTVSRGAMQRMWGVGNLRIETAGQRSLIEIHNVDDAQAVADRILAARGLPQ